MAVAVLGYDLFISSNNIYFAKVLSYGIAVCIEKKQHVIINHSVEHTHY